MNVDLVEFRTLQAADVIGRVAGPRFADATADHPEVLTWVQRYLTDPSACPSLVLVGPTGVGKTWQAWGALRAIITTLAASGRGLVWRAVTHPDLNDKLRPKPDGSHAWALDRYLRAELLLVDDLGAGKQTDWTGDSLFRLVDGRWSHQLPTIYSTNLTQQQLADAVGDRVVSRLADSMRVQLCGSDRRWEGAAR